MQAEVQKTVMHPQRPMAVAGSRLMVIAILTAQYQFNNVTMCYGGAYK